MTPGGRHQGDSRLCPVVEGILRVGGKWRLAVVYSLLEWGPLSFTELKDRLGAPSKTLSTAIKALEREGIVARTLDPRTGRMVYTLTSKGRDLKPVIDALRHWSTKWLATQLPQGNHYEGVNRGLAHPTVDGGRGVAKIRIIAKRNGPYLIEVEGKVKAALCRCGHSGHKPFCDGTHAKVGFQAEEAVPFEYEA